MFNKWVEHLVQMGVIEKLNKSEWGDSSFAQPKHETNQVFF